MLPVTVKLPNTLKSLLIVPGIDVNDAIKRTSILSVTNGASLKVIWSPATVYAPILGFCKTPLTLTSNPVAVAG